MIRYLLASAALFTASSAAAQGAPLPDPNDRSDTVTLAAGGYWAPDYEGSDDYRFGPAAAIRGRVAGFEFFTRATWLYVDLIRQPSSGIDLDFGPIVGARMNRSRDVKDARVDKLPELDAAIEVGGFGGVSWHGLTNPYDVLSLRIDVVTDVGGAHKSTLITPTIDFGTPLSRTLYLGASASLEWAGGGYADHYYSISPAEGAVAGLPAYDADGGLKHWRIGLLANQSITGDLTHGLSVFGTGAFTRLVGDFADSPVVDQRGSASQWLAAVGLAYTW